MRGFTIGGNVRDSSARLRDASILQVQSMRHNFSAACYAAAFVLGAVVSSAALAEPANSAPRNEQASADRAAIQAGSQAFVTAFNQGDAKSIAALWTADGDYVNEAGTRFTGRAAIEKEYGAFFAAHGGHKIKLVIDAIKFLGDSAAVEDGRAMLDPPPPGAPAVSKYTAIHVKVDGQWLMSTVRDARVETPSSYRNVADLDWLIGTWAAEEHGAKTASSCRWVANKSFVERSYAVTHADGSSSSGVQLIGWNPQNGQVQSWNFSSDGGHATGIWSPMADGWSAEVRGVMGAGEPTSAVNLLKRLDDNTYSWQSVQRIAGGQSLPDTDEIILKRKVK